MKFATRDDAVAAKNLIGTLAIYGASIAMALVIAPNWIAASPFIVCAAMMVMRFYILQHDCGHFAFFADRNVNHYAGRFFAIFTLASFDAMRFNHNLHHAHTSDLDQRESHEVMTLTLAEFESLPLWAQLRYRAYRNPITMFLIGPSLIFLLRYRLPNNWARTGVLDVIRNNIFIAIYWGTLFALAGWPALIVMLATTALAASFGVIIVYLQHNFENTYWEHNPDLNIETAALKGSSVLDFGALFDLVTANIAYHDLHHLNAKIPSYRLKACHQALSNRLSPNRIGWAEGLRSLQWKLWDEDAGRMVMFPPAKQPLQAHQHQTSKA